MSDREIIDRLAKYLEWHTEKHCGEYSWWTKDGSPTFLTHDNDDYESISFNPLKDWNHWRQVEEKMMEDAELLTEFCLKFSRIGERMSSHPLYMAADLPTRCKALLSIL